MKLMCSHVTRESDADFCDLNVTSYNYDVSYKAREEVGASVR
jgi:hypothetical protein